MLGIIADLGNDSTMTTTLKLSRPAGVYLAREAALVLLWAFAALVAGTVDGLFRFNLQLYAAVVLGGVMVLWLGARLWQKRGLPRTGLEWAIIIFLVMQGGLTLLSIDPRRSLAIPAQTLAYALIFLCAFDLTRSGWPAELTEKTLLIVGGIAAGLALVNIAQVFLNWLTITAGLPHAPSFVYRLYTPLGDANLVAAFFNMIIPLAVARALTTPARLPRFLLGALVAASLVAEVFTRSRGGLGALVVSTGVFALLWIIFVSPEARARAARWWAAWRARPLVLGGLLLLAVIGAVVVGVPFLQLRGNNLQGPLLSARNEYWGAANIAWQASPLWGSGPGTFPTDFIRYYASPPGRPYLHAHNILLTTLAESGLIGLAGLFFGLGLVARAWWRAREQTSRAGRARWVAVAAMWVAFMGHGLFDDHTRFVAVTIPLGVLLAAVLAESPRAESPRAFHPVWLIVPGLALAAFSIYSLRAYAVSEQAVALGAKDWARTAQLFDEATRLDPSLAFYWQQAGYAYGRLAAEGDEQALSPAIERLKRARALEPAYTVTAANLAALYWQAGRSADAEAEMRRAAELAPGFELPPLNLGVYAEALHRETEAQDFYRAALKYGGSAQTSEDFWGQSSARAAILAEWQAAREPDWSARVEAALAAQDFVAAERELVEAWQTNDQIGTVYRYFARLAQARGDLTLARRYSDCALWVQSPDVYQQTWSALEAADIARASGDLALAEFRYRAVLNAATDYGAYGWGSGTAGWSPYAFFTFQRRGLGDELLPQLVRADFMPELGRSLLALGQLYEDRGEKEKAAQVYRQLLARDELLVEAREGLERVEEP